MEYDKFTPAQLCAEAEKLSVSELGDLIVGLLQLGHTRLDEVERATEPLRKVLMGVARRSQVVEPGLEEVGGMREDAAAELDLKTLGSDDGVSMDVVEQG